MAKWDKEQYIKRGGRKIEESSVKYRVSTNNKREQISL